MDDDKKLVADDVTAPVEPVGSIAQDTNGTDVKQAPVKYFTGATILQHQPGLLTLTKSNLKLSLINQASGEIANTVFDLAVTDINKVWIYQGKVQVTSSNAKYEFAFKDSKTNRDWYRTFKSLGLTKQADKYSIVSVILVIIIAAIFIVALINHH